MIKITIFNYKKNFFMNYKNDYELNQSYFEFINNFIYSLMIIYLF